MAGSAVKDRVVYPLQKRVINPIVMLAHNLGFPPPGDALLETTGRRTGLPRRTPVCDGLDGEVFWLVAQRAAPTGSGTSRPIRGSGSRYAAGPALCGGPGRRASWTMTTRVSGGG